MSTMETSAPSTSAQGSSSTYSLDELTNWYESIAPPILPQSTTVLPQQPICALNGTAVQNTSLVRPADLSAPSALYQTTLTNMPLESFLPSYTGTTQRYVRGQTRATRGRGRRRRSDVDPRTRNLNPVSSAHQFPTIPYTGPYGSVYSQGNTLDYSRPQAQAVRRLDRRTTEGKRQYRMRRKELDEPCEEELNELRGSLRAVENVLFFESEKAESLHLKKITALMDKMYTLKQSPYAKAQFKKCLEESTTVFEDRNSSYQRKVNTLLILWDHTLHRIKSKEEEDEKESTFISKLVDWTLHIILNPSWVLRPAHNRHWIAYCVERAWSIVSAPVQAELDRVKHLIDTHNWDCLALRAMMDASPLDQTTRFEEFCSSEGWKLLLVRIKVMCEVGCFDVALSISTVLVNQLNDREEFRYQVPPDKALLVRDLFLMLLVKCGRYSELLDYLMFYMRPCSGNNMIGRLSQFKNPEIPEKLHDSVPQLLSWCSTLFLIVVLHRPPASNDPGLVSSLVGHWLLYGIEGSLSEAAHGILPMCKYVEHIYTFCSEIYNQLGTNQRNLCVELFIRAISRGATLLRYYLQENSEARALKCKSLLASTFLQLAKLFEDDVKVSREFVLTAFSLNPDQSCYMRLVKLAARSGKFLTDEEEEEDCGDDHCGCPRTGGASVLCERCGLFSRRVAVGCEFDALGSERLVGLPGYDPLVASCCMLEPRRLGLSPEVCEDLVSLVGSLRHRGLSWSVDWRALRDACLRYVTEYDPLHGRARELRHLKLRHQLLERRAQELKRKLGEKLARKRKGVTINNNFYVSLNFVNN